MNNGRGAKEAHTSKENSEVLLARQSIMNRQGGCVGHELLFRSRSRDATAVIDDDFACTMSVMQNLLGAIGVDTVLGESDGFLNCTSEILASEFIDILPAQQIVLEILETVELNDALAQRCLELKKRGFRIALDDVREMTPEVCAFLPYVDLVKIDWPFIEAGTAARITAAFHRAGKSVLAEKVETQEDYARAHDIGCDLFQGFYFTRPQSVTGNTLPVNTAEWLRILDLALREARIEEIERALKASPSLTVQILRLTNGISRWRTHISELVSVRQALSLVGLKQLARWCCFMLYGAIENGRTDPLVQLVTRRASFMDRIARKLFPNNEDLRQETYFTALLSLAHIPQGMDEQSFMSRVPVGPSIRDAVVSRSGWLGALLVVAECVEKGAFPSQAQLEAVSPDHAQSLLDGLYL